MQMTRLKARTTVALIALACLGLVSATAIDSAEAVTIDNAEAVTIDNAETTASGMLLGSDDALVPCVGASCAPCSGGGSCQAYSYCFGGGICKSTYDNVTCYGCFHCT